MNQRKKIILGISAAIVVLMLATNPDQASHLRAIKDTADLARAPFYTPPSVTDFLPMLKYNNYFLFSTTALSGGVVTWGAFGKVYTTNRVSKPF
jgi:hypothetical protein